MNNAEIESNNNNLNEDVYLEELLEGNTNITQNTKNEELLKHLKVFIFFNLIN